MENFWTALGLTVFAGMATGIGSAIAFFTRTNNYRFLSISTGFSAGVMLYVSFAEILLKGESSLTRAYGEYAGQWVNAGAFFGGILLIGLIDTFIPEAENPHEVHRKEESSLFDEETAVREVGRAPDSRLLRMGLFTALAIGIHNFPEGECSEKSHPQEPGVRGTSHFPDCGFLVKKGTLFFPEGLATFLAALEDPGVGAAIAVAIALHNIPEGISVSVPIYYATGNRKKAFFYSVLSGLSEPVGALIAFMLIKLFTAGGSGAVPPEVMGILFAGVAGIMVYISLDELLPTSRAYGRGHDSILGLVCGMAVMAVSLLLMM